MKLINVLIVEDCKYWADINIRQLMKAGFVVEYQLVSNEKAMAKALMDKQWHLIISDNNMSDFNALQALELRNKINGGIPFIIVSEDISQSEVNSAFANGCDVYIPKVEYARLREAAKKFMDGK